MLLEAQQCQIAAAKQAIANGTYQTMQTLSSCRHLPFEIISRNLLRLLDGLLNLLLGESPCDDAHGCVSSLFELNIQWFRLTGVKSDDFLCAISGTYS